MRNESNRKILIQEEKEALRIKLYTSLVLFSIFVAVVIYVLVTVTFSSTNYRGDFRYRVIANNTEISISRIQSGSRRTIRTELHIPSHIGDLPITRIDHQAFRNGGVSSNRSSVTWRRLTCVHIPYGVRDIGRSAFAHNLLTEVDIPDSVTHIRREAFSSNLLTELTIPDSVTHIGTRAFTNNSLTYVSIPSHTSVHRSAFDSNVTVIRR
ncbi:MAG: leucine-rich repeat domain-containing protein [Defluviitaleaceae bacterium]|nr:leucine-rich repeat domain-containing protein [Defluviitaleaceae bacterium]